MMTVLVKKPNGHETLYECQELEKEPNAILMRGDNLGSGDCRGLEILGPGGSTMGHDWDRRVEARGVDSEPGRENTRATIFVMNRYGKTVQTYSL